MQVRAIVVEDETLTRRAIAGLLREQGWLVLEASDAAACEAALRAQSVDVALVDLGLPGRSGQELIGAMAQQGTFAILAVTAQADPEQRIAMLEAGADDYIVKPFHPGELVARVRAVLRRRKVQMGNLVQVAGWLIDLDARTARSLTAQDKAPAPEIILTRGEVAILGLLAEAQGRIVSRERLSKVAARSTQDGDLRTVDTLIYRLRRKFAQDDSEASGFILTVAGLGYRLALPDRMLPS